MHLRPTHARPTVQLLRRPDVHPDRADRYPVVGVVLDRRDCSSGARHTRDTHRPHDDVTEHRHQPATAASLLHQGVAIVSIVVALAISWFSLLFVIAISQSSDYSFGNDEDTHCFDCHQSCTGACMHVLMHT